MTRDELIKKAYFHIGAAKDSLELNEDEHYAQQMTALLDFLLEELIGGPPGAPAPHPAKFNPEKVLVDVANAVRHRPISITERWKIIYFHTRICCVPKTCAVPNQIVLSEFTEQMAREGFTTIHWHQIKMNIIALYKELES